MKLIKILTIVYSRVYTIHHCIATVIPQKSLQASPASFTIAQMKLKKVNKTLLEL